MAGPLGTPPGPSPPAIFRFSHVVSGMDALMMGALDHLDSTPEQMSASMKEKHVERSFKLLCEKVCLPFPHMISTKIGSSGSGCHLCLKVIGRPNV